MPLAFSSFSFVHPQTLQCLSRCQQAPSSLNDASTRTNKPLLTGGVHKPSVLCIKRRSDNRDVEVVGHGLHFSLPQADPETTTIAARGSGRRSACLPHSRRRTSQASTSIDRQRPAAKKTRANTPPPPLPTLPASNCVGTASPSLLLGRRHGYRSSTITGEQTDAPRVRANSDQTSARDTPGRVNLGERERKLPHDRLVGPGLCAPRAGYAFRAGAEFYDDCFQTYLRDLARPTAPISPAPLSHRARLHERPPHVGQTKERARFCRAGGPSSTPQLRSGAPHSVNGKAKTQYPPSPDPFCSARRTLYIIKISERPDGELFPDSGEDTLAREIPLIGARYGIREID
ncbi:hypothetical protein HPB50_010685 [Hyalomma asiaticum]|uniref:Uncharacterized protein n=1 Tax=Hyalomma asiaticum TaxID=266040 RepID=A0ACB7SJS7_HYAAI|nr:hypothetical protein HPB50_010685 [Hyalomma asiaticum]